MQRRTFLKAGLLGGAALAAASGGAWLLQQRKQLDAAHMPQTSTVLRAAIPALLGGATTIDVERALQQALTAINGLPPYTRAELGELMLLLDSAPGRWLAGIDSWRSVNTAQVSAFLQRWRTHRWQLMQAAYHALHDLVLGSWYADASSWAAIAYPGPPKL